MQVIPSIDLDGGRSRTVYWPGAASGVGAPTDRPERIAETFVAMGARLIHLVDFGGARAGVPVETDAIGVDRRPDRRPDPGGRRPRPRPTRSGLVFAAGATRAVLGTDIADQPDELRACLSVAGDWLAVGLDPRPERLAAYPWRRASPPTVETLVGELVGAGVGRFVLSHGGAAPDLERVRSLVRTYDAEILLAGGVRDLDGLRRSRDAGVTGVILGEALLTGAIDYPEALAAAA